MTQEEIIKEAMLLGGSWQDSFRWALKQEREECAKVCEDIDVEYEGEDVLATWCSKAIRARGETTLRGEV